MGHLARMQTLPTLYSEECQNHAESYCLWGMLTHLPSLWAIPNYTEETAHQFSLMWKLSTHSPPPGDPCIPWDRTASGRRTTWRDRYGVPQGYIRHHRWSILFWFDPHSAGTWQDQVCRCRRWFQNERCWISCWSTWPTVR